MIRKQTLWISVLFVLAALFAAACSSGGDSDDRGDGGSSVATSSDSNGSGNAGASTDTGGDSRPAVGVVSGAANNNDGGAGSSTGSSGSPADVSRDSFTSDVAYAASVAARTAQVEAYEFVMEFGMDGIPELPGGLTFSAEGAIDPANQRMRMRMDLNSLFDAVPAGTSDEELQMMRALLGDGISEFIADGDTVYMSWALFSAIFGADTKWISFSDPEANGDLLSGFGGVNVNQFGSGPDAFLSFFLGVDSIEETGRFVIRGVETTRFSGVIDLDQALALSDPAERAALQAQIDELGAYGLGSLPLDVWIDDDGYLRKFTMTFDFSELGGLAGGPTEMYVSLELFNFGDAVSITLPPADEVTEIDKSSLFGSFGDSS